MSTPDDPWRQPSANPPPPQPAWGYSAEYPPGYPWAAPGVEPTGTSTWAVVALVTGLLPLPPVAIGTGITALVRMRRTRESGRGLAVAGLVLGGLWLLVLAALIAFSGDGSGGSDGALGRVGEAGSTTVGTCLAEPTGDSSVSTVVDCAVDHDAEVFDVTELPGQQWPGYGEAQQEADARCGARFEDYVGTAYDDSDFDYGYFLPDQAEWIAGEHRVVCVVLAGVDDSLHGSTRDTGR